MDAVGGLDDAVQMAAERAAISDGAFRIRWLPRQRSFLERLSGSMEARAVRVASKLTGSLDPRLVALSSELDVVRRTAGTVQARLPLRISVR